ncbi:putative sulfate exporter family transporter [Campylobacter coli]|uniref:YeiH family protein n=1 Tax=Campylobacter coli TaxID=195 RepID=UPI0012CCA9AB|nr:YeiH family protein [Campylobacter coli]EAI7563145.1 YeiH family protein [Campylobacter coli]EAM0455102.1 YeiH family protein [Campylobacter coli]ECR3475473.1 YeiH family protein [Campylobacter coli]EDO8817093.1 putative sulfate exporter family transporter [Campylobacter coli]
MIKKIEHYKNILISNFKGLIFTASIVFFAMYLSSVQSIKDTTHLAAAAFAIIIGALLSPWFFKYQHHLQAGVHFSAKKLLRLGIILYGFNITLTELLSVGLKGFILSMIVIFFIFILALIVGVKVFKLDKETSMLVGAGSAICGAAAVLALESSLKSDPFKGILAVGTVVIFGLVFMFLYPIAFSLDLFPYFNQHAMGIFMGATLHEVANVAGAAEMAKDMANFDQSASNIAIIIKMMRVILLVPFLLIVTYFFAKNQHSSKEKTAKNISIPYFAFIFLGVIVINTYLASRENFLGISTSDIISFGKLLCTLCIVFAMAALGLQIDFKKFLKSGSRVFGLAFVLGLVLVFGGYFLTLFFRGILW